MKNKIKISTYLNDSNPTYVDLFMGDVGDEKRFLDLYTIIYTSSKDEAFEFKERIIKKVESYFKELLKAIKTNNEEKLNYLSKYIHEAKYTKIGFSKTGPGKGFGSEKFLNLVKAIRNSIAFKSNKINDILDIELYTTNVGVDIISDLITNLIQDVLGEYTEKKLNKLIQADKIRYVEMHYWNENSDMWKKKKIATVAYKTTLINKEYNYLLIPYCFTANQNQKQKIIGKIFNECVFEKFKKIILDDEDTYSKFIKPTKNSKKVLKKDMVNFLNENFGDNTAKKGNGYLTSKGLLDLVERYDDIKYYIENNIKR